MSDEELIYKYVELSKQEEALNKLKTGYPVQYLIGHVDFYDCNIIVKENVLIPRFETEYLVDKTLKIIKNMNLNIVNALEIGSGSGCISVAIAKNISLKFDSLDINKDAIELSKLNALNNNVDINYICEDINKFATNKKYNLIISNPPYVAYGSNVSDNIKYEPENAIYAPNEGLYFYDLILNKIKNNLCEDYLISFEIGDNQGDKIKDIVSKYLDNYYIKVEKDYNNYDRYVFISNKNIEY